MSTEQTDLAKLRDELAYGIWDDSQPSELMQETVFAALDRYAEAYAQQKLAALGIVLDTSGNERHLIPSALAKAQEDTARLDWLETGGAEPRVESTFQTWRQGGRKFRAAIDAARKESAK